jgi:hypothetical protein
VHGQATNPIEEVPMAKTHLRAWVCSICGHLVVTGLRGRPREVHQEGCKYVRDHIQELEHLLEGEGLRKLNLTPRAQADLRYRLFCLATQVPRVRDEHGRFLRSNGPSVVRPGDPVPLARDERGHWLPRDPEKARQALRARRRKAARRTRRTDP